jgi:hypothetical protein
MSERSAMPVIAPPYMTDQRRSSTHSTHARSGDCRVVRRNIRARGDDRRIVIDAASVLARLASVQRGTAWLPAPQGEKLMTRFSLCAALAALTVLAVAPNADARTLRTQDQAAIAGAHNSITDENRIRQTCAETARSQWPSSNQEMQTNRDFALRNCLFGHGVRNP